MIYHQLCDSCQDKFLVNSDKSVLGMDSLAAAGAAGSTGKTPSLIEKLVTSGEIAPEPIDDREGLKTCLK